jgi:hypothetical protein
MYKIYQLFTGATVRVGSFALTYVCCFWKLTVQILPEI